MLLTISLFVGGCSSSNRDTINIPSDLKLKPEIATLFSDKDIQDAIITYTKDLVQAYNTRKDSIPEVSAEGESAYKVFTNYIQGQSNGVFKSSVSNEERDLRMQRIEKSIEIQEVGADIAKLKLTEKATFDASKNTTTYEKLDSAKASDLKTKINTFIKDFFQV